MLGALAFSVQAVCVGLGHPTVLNDLDCCCALRATMNVKTLELITAVHLPIDHN